MRKILLDWNQVERQVLEILRQITQDSWRPDYVVGLTRGGLVPANLISQFLGVPMHALKVSLRDSADNGSESNLWMAEDAFGVVPSEQQQALGSSWDPSRRKRILIVDDINDSGATLNWIQQDWQSGCYPSQSAEWASVWQQSVRVAVLYDNESSESRLTPTYAAESINKAADPCWIVFPWEEWWYR